MNSPVPLTPGFSSLVFEFWMFDFGCISFGIFQIRIRDAGSLRLRCIKGNNKSSLCNPLLAPLLCFVLSDLILGDQGVVSQVRRNSSKLFQKDPTITLGSLWDDGITNLDLDHQNGINQCTLYHFSSLILILNIGLPPSFLQFCILYHHTLHKAKDESKKQHNSVETSFLGFFVT